ncbi:MAG: anthranilate phosphoribosyltransferase [Deltaproteobacteria bacterium]|jgi:anthranilate synthase/phosphoribosyltransferase|nr:anthranilate phosphoribosyltransferase [Deltaproteobacteria bacterium]
MLLLIDNYDSFTYNLSQSFQVLGYDPLVLRNDDPSLLEMTGRDDLQMVCLSPGPGRPEEAGLCRVFLERLLSLGRRIPVLGVCLGHQVLSELAGLKVVLAGRIMHGRVSEINHKGTGLFRNLPNLMKVGRYHSLIASEPNPSNLTHRLEVTARTPEGEIMAINYLDQPWAGVQFHPESVLTPLGRDLLANFLAGETINPKPMAAPKETPKPLSVIFETLGRGEDLEDDLASQVFERLMDGELSASQAGALLMSLRTKGETDVEVAAAARAVLKRANSVVCPQGPVLDVVGTGGDNRFSFNCSTATAIVCAALGHKVLKHGNRSVSSRSGSADVLEKLGFDIELSETELANRLKTENFVFLFAPNFHPSFRHIMPVRRELGVRTLFNILGPLVNPARPSHRLIGVYQPELLDLMAGALARLGVEEAAVVHGAGGYDELTPLGPAEVRLIRGQTIESLTVNPAEFGIRPCTADDLAITDPAQGAEILHQLLAGDGPQHMRDMLVLNVTMALFLLKGGSLGERFFEASEALAQGVGAKILPNKKVLQ